MCMAHVSIVIEALQIDYDFLTVFKLETVLILSVAKRLENTLSQDKRKLSNGQSQKIWKETAFTE